MPAVTARRDVQIDWMRRENTHVRIWVIANWALKKFGCPSDLQNATVKLVLEQAETLNDDSAEGTRIQLV